MTIAQSFIVAALALGAALAPASAMAAEAQAATVDLVAASGCDAVGHEVAARNHGALLRASPEIRSGKTVCVVVVLVPGGKGQRPRRMEFVEPRK